MIEDSYFAPDYDGARETFLQAAELARLDVATSVHPLQGPAGQALATDTLRIGPADAETLLVLTSGMHGPELMCGSGCQVAALTEGWFERLPEGVAVLMVHAINPWGAAHVRRNNEDNVDLCRNFIDFSDPPAVNSRYEEVHAAFTCSERRGPARDAALAALRDYRRVHGPGGYGTALMTGQYAHPDGISFGGRGPTWSNRLMTGLVQEHGRGAKRVALVDYHSGLGPWSHGSAVCMYEGERLERAHRWYGPWIWAPRVDVRNAPEECYDVTGHSSDGYDRMLPGVDVTAMVLEYGTRPSTTVFDIMLDDHWLTFFGDRETDEGRAIKAQLLDAFYPDDAEWRWSIVSRARQVARQAMAGLRAVPAL
ncbi:M14 family metallopeptidase [Sphingomonas sp. YL-JM2C]